MAGKGHSISNSVYVRSGRGRGYKGKGATRYVRDSEVRQRAAARKLKHGLAGLNYESREQLESMDVDVRDWDNDPDMGPVPPGDEGVLASHEGGEAELCMDMMRDKGKRYDGRSRRDRTQSRNAQWASQVPALADAYLNWKRRVKPDIPANSRSPAAGGSSREHSGNPSPSVSSAGTRDYSASAAGPSTARTPGAGMGSAAGEDHGTSHPYADEGAAGSSSSERTWQVLVADFFTTSTSSFTPSGPLEMATVTLANHGCLATAPVYPTMAISFYVLEAYRQLHGACPRLSVHAFCQALCGIHHVLYRPTFAEQFSIAFDVYLDILHNVDGRLNVVLARDTPNWRMLNACTPCMYKVEGETPLPFDILAAMDGNSSLKLVDDSFRSGQARIDERTCRTDLFIPADQVDKFKDEVQSAQKKKPPLTTGGPDNPFGAFPLAPQSERPAADVAGGDALVGQADMENNVEEPADSKSICADRWRNAGPETHKKMFALFQATGIFVCLCRHGHVLVMCDMIRSGELMKYPLALVDKLVEVYGPDKVKLGYDIGCEFQKTLSRSSVGPRAEGVVSSVVPAFHGHSHNRGCQVLWHPLYMDGVGKEDFEGSERLFAFMNGVASGTRLSSPFHRHQAIEGAVGFWCEQKYIAAGKFIYNNYRQALQIIQDGERELAGFALELKTTSASYEEYLEQERAYLRNLKSEPPQLTLRCEYVEALQEREREGIKDRAAVEAHTRLDALLSKNRIPPKEVRAVQREFLNARDRVDRAEEKVRRYEDILDVASRWLPSSSEYQDVAQELVVRKYRRALDNLEHLVVQRLFELKKLGMNGVGYKQREKIGQALKTRAQAIRTALNSYNKEAAALNPPRPDLSWTEVMNMVSIGEFDLLRDSRTDIRQQSWAKPRHREATTTYFNVKRAREEIQRDNVEITRLFTSLVDEHVDYVEAIEQTRETDPALSSELETRHRYRGVLSAHIVGWLVKTSRLAGFTGRVGYGQRVGRDKTRILNSSLPLWATLVGASDGGSQGSTDVVDGDQDDDTDDLEDGDGIPGVGGAGDSGRFVQFVDGLSDL